MNGKNLETKIRQLLLTSEQEALEEFLEEQDIEVDQFRPPSLREMRQKFEKWLGEKKSKVCLSETVRKAVVDGDEYLIAAAIADVLGGYGVATASVLTARYGVKRLCAQSWDEIDKNEDTGTNTTTTK